ncbi:hypothetical protein [Pseudomonas petrae]|uniref:Lipoprotein n=1 Tax=Pseudomonas petrae TaxID=2912190 RepID=A0ABS9I6X2_9PSED|nr:hypothetical protein [Pseudomonas petrae]MCF7532185.1 hypothetical protein [Pseudomonas petrae]MCF7537718.1 hypothetical protein [Pseudomonas petrae]MCF7543510.1 hypothetical protein [Pseudomonas petrae]MCF7556574.1 hypothetical protein [Pseudomonas petrae]
MNARWAVLWCVVVVAGCQSTHDQLLAEGYPPAFADGFQDGCGSGRQSIDVIKGQFKKDVPRYLRDTLYAQGWSDGFRQCQAQLANSNVQDQGRDSIWNDRDRDWDHQRTQDAAKAYRSH